jgi:hypothetical protein
VVRAQRSERFQRGGTLCFRQQIDLKIQMTSLIRLGARSSRHSARRAILGRTVREVERPVRARVDNSQILGALGSAEVENAAKDHLTPGDW